MFRSTESRLTSGVKARVEMPNNWWQRFTGSGQPNKPRGKHGDKLPEKTASWGGLPGNTQPRERSAGVPKVKIHAKSEGI